MSKGSSKRNTNNEKSMFRLGTDHEASKGESVTPASGALQARTSEARRITKQTTLSESRKSGDQDESEMKEETER